MDWLDDFTKRFNNELALSQLEELKFNGSVTLHFSEGVVQKCEMKIFLKTDYVKKE